MTFFTFLEKKPFFLQNYFSFFFCIIRAWHEKWFWCKNKITKKSFCMKNDFFPPYYTGKNHFLWWKSLFGKKPFFIFFCIIRAWSVLLKFFGRVWVQFSGIVKMSSVPPSAYCKPKQIISWENPLIDHYFVLHFTFWVPSEFDSHLQSKRNQMRKSIFFVFALCSIAFNYIRFGHFRTERSRCILSMCGKGTHWHYKRPYHRESTWSQKLSTVEPG